MGERLRLTTSCADVPEHAGDVDGMAAHALMRLHTDPSGDWQALAQPFRQPPTAPQVSEDSGEGLCGVQAPDESCAMMQKFIMGILLDSFLRCFT